MTRIGLTPAQCRVARNAVGMSQRDLANDAAVSLPVVQEFEGKRGRVPMEKNLRDIRDALAAKGVQFQMIAKGVSSVTFTDEHAEAAQNGGEEGGK